MDAALGLFLLFAAAAVAGAVAMVLSRSPVHAVLYLVITILALAGLFVTLDAQFLATLQVIVYAGAIMVLFLFVIMMLNFGPGPELPGFLGRPAALIVGGLLMAQLAVAILWSAGWLGRSPAPAPAMPRGSVENVGALLFSQYVLPMELASVLLLVGMVGAVALSRPVRRPKDEEP